uniref:Cystatin domain-containing protein n=1 Tax=Panagrellus redivivus TaxID=6233 RepID=A0A7E4VMZ7_PANRE
MIAASTMNALIFFALLCFVSAEALEEGFRVTPVDDTVIQAVVRVAEQLYNAEVNSKHYYIAKTILKAESYYYGDADYYIDVLFAEASCGKPPKPNVLCVVNDDSRQKKVRVNAHVSDDGEVETCTFKRIR